MDGWDDLLLASDNEDIGRGADELLGDDSLLDSPVTEALLPVDMLLDSPERSDMHPEPGLETSEAGPAPLVAHPAAVTDVVAELAILSRGRGFRGAGQGGRRGRGRPRRATGWLGNAPSALGIVGPRGEVAESSALALLHTESPAALRGLAPGPSYAMAIAAGSARAVPSGELLPRFGGFASYD